MGTEVAAYVRVPWGSADDCRQSPRLLAGALCMGMRCAGGWVGLEWGRLTRGKLWFFRYSDEHNLRVVAVELQR